MNQKVVFLAASCLFVCVGHARPTVRQDSTIQLLSDFRKLEAKADWFATSYKAAKTVKEFEFCESEAMDIAQVADALQARSIILNADVMRVDSNYRHAEAYAKLSVVQSGVRAIEGAMQEFILRQATLGDRTVSDLHMRAEAFFLRTWKDCRELLKGV